MYCLPNWAWISSFGCVVHPSPSISATRIARLLLGNVYRVLVNLLKGFRSQSHKLMSQGNRERESTWAPFRPATGYTLTVQRYSNFLARLLSIFVFGFLPWFFSTIFLFLLAFLFRTFPFLLPSCCSSSLSFFLTSDLSYSCFQSVFHYVFIFLLNFSLFLSAFRLLFAFLYFLFFCSFIPFFLHCSFTSFLFIFYFSFNVFLFSFSFLFFFIRLFLNFPFPSSYLYVNVFTFDESR
jgi:hypothetical protein